MSQKIYRKDDAFFVETGEKYAKGSRAVAGAFYLSSLDDVVIDDGSGTYWADVRILRRLPLTLPLVAGQVVLCRDGQERTIGCDVEIDCGCQKKLAWIGEEFGVWNDSGRCFSDIDSTIKHGSDALADSPAWKRCPCQTDDGIHARNCPEFKEEKQAAAAGGLQEKASAPLTPAAAPAILPHWTDADVLCELDRMGIAHALAPKLSDMVYYRERVADHLRWPHVTPKKQPPPDQSNGPWQPTVRDMWTRGFMR